MLIEFGQGKVAMHTYKSSESIKCGLALKLVDEPHQIGEQDPSYIGRDVNELEPEVCLEFSNSESLKVLIEQLEIVKSDLKFREALQRTKQ